MEEMLTVADIQGILRVSKSEAYTIMHSIKHIESPLRTTEKALNDWIAQKMIDPRVAHERRRKNDKVGKNRNRKESA